jgi:hypothetical protein
MEKLLAYHNMKKIELEINEKNELVNKNGDTFTIKSEEFDDFLIGCKVLTGSQKDVFEKKDMLDFSKFVYNNWVSGQTIDKCFLEWTIKHYR